MKDASIRDGMQILSAYVSGERHSLCAEHDQIWFGPEDGSAVTEWDTKALEDLGWFLCKDSGRWSAYV